MNNVTTLRKTRTIGSLTSDDLGVPIEIGDTIIEPVMVLHTVNAETGEEHTVLYDNPFLLFPYTETSDTVFTPLFEAD